MRKKLLWVPVILLSVGLSACGSSSEGNNAAVQSVSVLCGYSSVGSANRFLGVVTSESAVQVKKSDDLTVEEVLVSVGDEVKAGQVLFRYDGDKAQLNLDKAQLELSQLNNSITSKTEQITQLQKSQASATTSDQKLEYSLQIQEAQADIEEDNYNKLAKEKEVAKLQKTVENLEVVSPTDGVIKSIAEDSSQSSDSDSMLSNGSSQAYIVITKSGNLRVKGYINENNRNSLEEGTAVRLISRVDEEEVWAGTVTSIDWQNPASSGNEDSGTSDDMSTSSKYPFYIDLDDPDGLILGQHLYIEIVTEEMQEENGIHLAAGFINDPDGDAWVWAEDSSGKLEKRSVTLGNYDSEVDSYVIADGLSLEDYVAYPENSLQAGMICIEYETSYEEQTGEESSESME